MSAKPNKPIVGGIIEARMGSSRLPGKVMKDIVGKPLLQHIIERIQKCHRLDTIVVATTHLPQDNVIEALAVRLGIHAYRGDVEDVSSRVRDAARAFHIDVIVKISGDNPFYHDEYVDPIIDAFQKNDCDFLTNTVMGFSTAWKEARTWPIGAGICVFETDLLDRVLNMDLQPADREHVIKYIIDRPEQFRLGAFRAEGPFSVYRRPELRFAVDTQEDLEFTRAIFEKLYGRNPVFPLSDVVDLLDKNPEIRGINAHVIQKSLAPATT